MKINIKNELKITAAIKDAEGVRVSARLGSFHQIQANVRGIEKRLNMLLGSAKNWKGVRVEVSENFGPKPGAYRGTPESTQMVIERFGSGWFLIEVNRTVSSTNRDGDWQILLSDDLKLKACKHLLSTQMTEGV